VTDTVLRNCVRTKQKKKVKKRLFFFFSVLRTRMLVLVCFAHA
jgi:hypothetical protein